MCRHNSCRSPGFTLGFSNPPPARLPTPLPRTPPSQTSPASLPPSPLSFLPPTFHQPPPTSSTTANNSVITDFFPPTAGDSANLLIKDPVTMGSVWTDYNRSRNTAVLILEDSCLGASQTAQAPFESGPAAQSPRPPHLHGAHRAGLAGKSGDPAPLHFRVAVARTWGEGGRGGSLLPSDGSGGSTSSICPDPFSLLSLCSPLFAFPFCPSPHLPGPPIRLPLLSLPPYVCLCPDSSPFSLFFPWLPRCLPSDAALM